MNLLIRFTRINEFYGTVVLTSVFGLLFSSNPQFVPFFTLVLANLTCMSFIFAINDYEDADDDAKDPKKSKRNTISSGELDKKKARQIIILLFVVASILYLFLSIELFLIGLAGLIFGFLYSYKKVRLKSMPILDLVSHGYWFGLMIFIMPIVVFGSKNLNFSIWYAICIFLQSAMVGFMNQVRDYDLDRKSGIKNTMLFFGLGKLRKYVFHLWAVIIFLFLVPILYTKSIPIVYLLILVILGGSLLFGFKNRIIRNDLKFPHLQLLLLMFSILIFIITRTL